MSGTEITIATQAWSAPRAPRDFAERVWARLEALSLEVTCSFCSAPVPLDPLADRARCPSCGETTVVWRAGAGR